MKHGFQSRACSYTFKMVVQKMSHHTFSNIAHIYVHTIALVFLLLKYTISVLFWNQISYAYVHGIRISDILKYIELVSVKYLYEWMDAKRLYEICSNELSRFRNCNIVKIKFVAPTRNIASKMKIFSRRK